MELKSLCLVGGRNGGRDGVGGGKTLLGPKLNLLKSKQLKEEELIP
jgi:hypothetical protein